MSNSKNQVTVIYDKETLRKAEVFLNNDVYSIDYYQGDVLLRTEHFQGKSIHFVEDAAENFVVGIKNV